MTHLNPNNYEEKIVKVDAMVTKIKSGII